MPGTPISSGPAKTTCQIPPHDRAAFGGRCGARARSHRVVSEGIYAAASFQGGWQRRARDGRHRDIPDHSVQFMIEDRGIQAGFWRAWARATPSSPSRPRSGAWRESHPWLTAWTCSRNTRVARLCSKRWRHVAARPSCPKVTPGSGVLGRLEHLRHGGASEQGAQGLVCGGLRSRIAPQNVQAKSKVR